MENTINELKDKIYALIEEFKRLFKLNKNKARSIYKSKSFFVREEKIFNKDTAVNNDESDSDDETIDDYSIERLSEKVIDYFGNTVIIRNNCSDKDYLLKLNMPILKYYRVFVTFSLKTILILKGLKNQYMKTV